MNTYGYFKQFPLCNISHLCARFFSVFGAPLRKITLLYGLFMQCSLYGAVAEWTALHPEEEAHLIALCKNPHYKTVRAHFYIPLATSYLLQGKDDEAHIILKKLIHIAAKNTSDEIVKAITTLFSEVDIYYKEQIAKADMLYAQHAFQEAAACFMKICTAAQKQIFFYSMSPTTKQALITHCTTGCMKSLFFAGNYPSCVEFLQRAHKNIEDGSFYYGVSLMATRSFTEARRAFDAYIHESKKGKFYTLAHLGAFLAAYRCEEYIAAKEILHVLPDALEQKEQACATLELVTLSDAKIQEYAAESLFRQFPEEEYIHKTPHAIAHLKELITAYPCAPIAIAAHVYIGNSLKDKQDASAMQEAVTHFQQALAIAPSGDLVDYLTKMLQEAHLNKAKTEITLVACSSSTIFLLESAEGSLKALLNTELHIQASYYLAVVYDLQEKAHLSRKQLENIVECQVKTNAVGAFFAKAYLMLGAYECAREHFTEALLLLAKAEAVRGSDQELLLQIWIATASCYKKMGQLDKAMTMLSRVINENIASSLRIQAMLHRAEIYELHGRRDLAIKQLEAAARKGGEWSVEAQKKLAQNYGYQHNTISP